MHDNTAFYYALTSSVPTLPVFIYDTNILDELPEEDRRLVFIRNNLKKMQEKFKDKGSSFYILHDTPLNAFEKLCNEFEVQKVFTNHDYEPYARERDKNIEEFLSDKNIGFQSYKDQVIFEKSEVLNKSGKPYKVFTPYSKMWKKEYKKNKPELFESEKYLANLLQTDPFHFPSLDEIGFKEVDIHVRPPRVDKDIIKNYDETRDIPGIEGTSELSVHLRFGTGSIRRLMKLAQKLNETYVDELIWREFYMMILWHYPKSVNKNFKPKYDGLEWRNDEEEFEKWCQGKTGFPIVDAGMRQLNKIGWMHNRVRMITGSFLCKDLLIDWRWGEAYFAEKLIDYELSSNVGNWQWVAGTGVDAAPYFRIFNPATQTEKYDPEQKYIKKWIEDYEPGYEEPMVDHKKARERALEVYKKAADGS